MGAKAATCADLAGELRAQREAHAGLLTEAGVMEERVHKGKKVAEEAGTKVCSLKANLEEARQRAAKAEALMHGTASPAITKLLKEEQGGQSPEKIALLGKLS